MQTKKIWCVSKYASPELYGPSTKLYNTAMYLSNYYNVTLITSNANQKATYPQSSLRINTEQIKTLRHVWIKLPNFNKSRSLKRLFGWFMFDKYVAKLPKKLNEIPDIILVSSLPLTTIRWALAMKKKFNSKVIFEVRDIYPLTLTEMGYSKFNPIIIYFSLLEKIGYKDSDLIVGTMSRLNEHTKNILGYSKETFYSPIGITPIYFKKKFSTLRVKNKTKTTIGYIGSVGIANNLAAFVDAMRSLEHLNTIEFILVGDGEYLSEIKKQELTNVSIIGNVSSRDVHKFIDSCDILYLSTLNTRVLQYGQSMNKLREYMYSGKPIIASYNGYLENELITPGLFVVKPNNSNEIVKAIEHYRFLNEVQLDEIFQSNQSIAVDNYSYSKINRAYKIKIESLF